MSNTNPARGMRDFLPADIRKRNYVINIIKEVYESYGFEPLETPSVENLETLTGKYGEEGNQLMYKILKRGEKLDVNDKELADLALRYDLTVPLARVIANYKNDLPKFFKRYQIQPVWRADRPARGRYREFYQCDVDAIGSSSMIVEAELISAVSEILNKLGFNDFVIRVNHRNVLIGLLQEVNIPVENHIDALISIDKLDKTGYEGVLTELINRGIDEKTSSNLISLFKVISLLQDRVETVVDSSSKISNEIKASPELKSETINKTILEKCRKNLKNIEIACEGIDDLENITKWIKDNKAFRHIRIDPSLARGLSYYTGAIFEVVLTNGDFQGSIAGGGRYDGLIGMFGKEEIPAVGFSLGLERILLVMDERGMFPEELQQNSADVMVTIWNEESIGESLKLANELRSQGLRVLVYPETDKLGKQFKYADSIKIPFVCVLGETELAGNKVTVKNMKSGGQETVERSLASEKIK